MTTKLDSATFRTLETINKSSEIKGAFPKYSQPVVVQYAMTLRGQDAAIVYERGIRQASEAHKDALEKVLGPVAEWRTKAEYLATAVDFGQLGIADLNDQGLPKEDTLLTTDARRMPIYVSELTGDYWAVGALNKFLDYFDRLVRHIVTRKNNDNDQNPEITLALTNFAKSINDNFLKPFIAKSQSYVGQFKTIERLNLLSRDIRKDLSQAVGLDSIQKANPQLMDYDMNSGLYWDIKELAKQEIDYETARIAYWDILEARHEVGSKTMADLKKEWLELKRDITELNTETKARSRFLILEANFCSDNNFDTHKLADLMETDIGQRLEAAYQKERLSNYAKINWNQAAIDFFKYDGLQTLCRIDDKDTTSKAAKDKYVKDLTEECFTMMQKGNVQSFPIQDQTKLVVAQVIKGINPSEYHNLRNKLMGHLITQVNETELARRITLLKQQIQAHPPSLNDIYKTAQSMKTNAETFSNNVELLNFLALELVAINKHAYSSSPRTLRDLTLPTAVKEALEI